MGELDWPFIGAEALRAGLIPERAMRTLYQPIYPNVYVPWGLEPSAVQRAHAAWLWSKRRGVVAGQSAAAVLGAKWVDRAQPAELIHDNRRPPQQLVARSEGLNPDECQLIDGMSVTTAARTAFDIGRHTQSRRRAVQALDALSNATGVKPIDVEALMEAHPGARAIPRLRRSIELMEGGAESPQETDARLALIDAGLPAPTTQVRVFDEWGLLIGRVDMAYEDLKVGIEYDGPQHWTDPRIRQRDIDKGVEFQRVDWNIIRVSSGLLYQRRATYVARVVAALVDRGMTW